MAHLGEDKMKDDAFNSERSDQLQSLLECSFEFQRIDLARKASKTSSAMLDKDTPLTKESLKTSIEQSQKKLDELFTDALRKLLKTKDPELTE